MSARFFFSCHGNATVCFTLIMVLRGSSLTGADALSVSGVNTERLAKGRELYVKNCFICHQLNGQGLPGSYPPLADSDFLRDEERTILQKLPSGVAPTHHPAEIV